MDLALRMERPATPVAGIGFWLHVLYARLYEDGRLANVADGAVLRSSGPFSPML